MPLSPYDAAYRRILITLDVPAMMRLDRHHSPYLPRQTEAETLCAMHVARVEMKTLPKKLRDYSRDWLKERGIVKANNQWTFAPPSTVVAESVGIASRSQVPGLSSKIVHAMSDALDNARAKGITEPERQREDMLKARAKVRFKGRHI